MKISKFFILVCFILIFFLRNAESEVLFISNKSVKQRSLTKQNIQKIFLGKRKKWSGDHKIYIAILVKGATHKEFLAKYVKKDPVMFSSYWYVKTMGGTKYPPKKFITEAALIDYVAGKRGAIGYISAGTLHEGVNVFSVK